LVGQQEGHLAWKNWVVRYWRGYLSGGRCRFAYLLHWLVIMHFLTTKWKMTMCGCFQTCMGKDVTLHVSASNPAMLLYQKFGFKAKELVLDFYDKYLPAESTECRHAYFLRLRRWRSFVKWQFLHVRESSQHLITCFCCSSENKMPLAANLC